MDNQIKGILFDLDGTLVDSLSITFDAFNDAILHFGGRRHTPEEIVAYFGPSEKIILGQILGDHLAGAAFQRAKTYMEERLLEMPLFPGVGAMLESLKLQGIPISIVTGRGWTSTESILKHHRLMDRFITVIANEHVERPKPAPDGILLACQRMGLLPNYSIYIGDSPKDVLAARGAGAQGVAALWDSMVRREHFSEKEGSHPHYFIESPKQVLEFL